MKTKYYCKCGREISYNSVHYGKGRCVWCANKGENNPNSKGLITLKKYFCIECNKSIHYQAYLYGKQMCGSCRQIGDRNSRYIDNRSHIEYPVSWTKALKRKILVRDNFTCQVCQKYPCQDLIIHHIDKNKLNCQEDNLITLCRNCHGQIHYCGVNI